MKFLIKKAKVINSYSSHDGKTVDILINKGRIENIKGNIQELSGVKVIASKNLHVSAGWIDIGTQVGEPGLEHREDLLSISKAAKNGGYVAIAPFPSTLPVVQTKAAIKFLLDNKSNNGLTILPLAALSIDSNGNEITEMIDLHHSGAIAFTDGLKSVSHSGVLFRALEYVKSFDGLIIHHSFDKTLSGEGQMHEGETSTQLGMRGFPSIAETISVKRDIELLNYTNSRLCLYAISSSDAVRIIKETKKTNQNLSATAAYLNLIKTDTELHNFDSNLKVNPPLRSKKDRADLIRAINEDTIDAIVSNHYPLEEEAKKLEFTYAKFGASGIETCFSALNTFAYKEISLEKLIQKLTEGPRSILRLNQETMSIGSEANLTLFDPEVEWMFNTTASKSDNNPFLGKMLKGKVLATFS